MADQFNLDFILNDGTDVHVKLQSEGCYQFFLLPPNDKEDSFTWDENEARDIIDAKDLNDCERRRNEALQVLWQKI